MNAVVKLQPRFRVDKGIPIAKRHCGPKPPLYPFMDMSVGDSFFIPAAERCMVAVQNKLQRHWNIFCQKNQGGYKFTCRRVESGVRCWRVK